MSNTRFNVYGICLAFLGILGWSLYKNIETRNMITNFVRNGGPSGTQTL